MQATRYHDRVAQPAAAPAGVGRMAQSGEALIPRLIWRAPAVAMPFSDDHIVEVPLGVIPSRVPGGWVYLDHLLLKLTFTALPANLTTWTWSHMWLIERCVRQLEVVSETYGQLIEPTVFGAHAAMWAQPYSDGYVPPGRNAPLMAPVMTGQTGTYRTATVYVKLPLGRDVRLAASDRVALPAVGLVPSDRLRVTLNSSAVMTTIACEVWAYCGVRERLLVPAVKRLRAHRTSENAWTYGPYPNQASVVDASIWGNVLAGSNRDISNVTGVELSTDGAQRASADMLSVFLDELIDGSSCWPYSWDAVLDGSGNVNQAGINIQLPLLYLPSKEAALPEKRTEVKVRLETTLAQNTVSLLSTVEPPSQALATALAARARLSGGTRSVEYSDGGAGIEVLA